MAPSEAHSAATGLARGAHVVDLAAHEAREQAAAAVRREHADRGDAGDAHQPPGIVSSRVKMAAVATIARAVEHGQAALGLEHRAPPRELVVGDVLVERALGRPQERRELVGRRGADLHASSVTVRRRPARVARGGDACSAATLCGCADVCARRLFLFIGTPSSSWRSTGRWWRPRTT